MARILVVEDDADLQQVLSHVLFRDGHEVHHAFNGQEGYEKILSARPDLVVLDLMMPVLSGSEVLKRVGENTSLREIPIIVMTAYSDGASVLEGAVRAQGAVEFLRKPFDVKELVRMIRRVLETRPPAPEVPARSVAKGGFRLDVGLRTVWSEGRLLATLRPKEARVLEMLMRSRGPVPRRRLLDTVWDGSGSEATLYKTVQRLRDALGAGHAGRIQTGERGYEFVA